MTDDAAERFPPVSAGRQARMWDMSSTIRPKTCGGKPTTSASQCWLLIFGQAV